MNLDQLKTFLAVAETGSLRAAGEKRHISQPAVTRQMQLLEESIRTKLLMHYGRGIRLTPAGVELHKEAVHIFHIIEKSIQNVMTTADATKSQIRLGVSHYVAVYKIPFLISQFRKKNPETQLLFHYGTSEEMIEMAETGKLTFGIGTLPGKSEKLVQIPLWVDTFFAILPEDHLFFRKKELTLEELANTDIILPKSGTTTRALIDRAFKARGISISPVMEVTYLETIKASVKMGIGTSILPGNMFLESTQDPPYALVKPIHGLSITRQLGLVYKKGRDLFKNEKALIDILKQDIFSGSTKKNRHSI
ncbi:MAG: LysR family transcriptional regulator [Nitrospiria bacterium]